MHRRTFLKLSVHLLGLIAGIRQRWLAAAAPHPLLSQSTPYGSGPYGEGPYQGGYTSYLPLVNREQD